MWQSKILIIVLVTLVIGFAGGFILRPVISPVQPTGTITIASPTAAVSSGARGPQYFSAHIDEARRVMAGCRDGSVRGEECANAQGAVTEAEGRDRFKKFMGH